MPNAISPEKRSITYLENRKVAEWMANLAKTRHTDLAVILREATAAYYAQDKLAPNASTLIAHRTATKAAARTQTARAIAAGHITPEEAQERNAPIPHPVQIVNLWSAIRRHTRT